jgi:hypothetical protein
MLAYNELPRVKRGRLFGENLGKFETGYLGKMGMVIQPVDTVVVSFVLFGDLPNPALSMAVFSFRSINEDIFPDAVVICV